MKVFFINLLFFLAPFILTGTANARCAICYTNGMSGASIAVIIIIVSFIILFIANKFLQKIINKN
tara:strand:+ start:369 stop:563 length:195 start_codon:yes stop_codon:yes gene_type:complete